MIARVADCPNCGHCVDLDTPSRDDADSLKKIRDEQFLTISFWIEDYWQNVSQTLDHKILLQEK